MSGSSNNGPSWGDNPTQSTVPWASSSSDWNHNDASGTNSTEGEEGGRDGDSGFRLVKKASPTFKDAGPMVEINVGSGKGKKQYLVYKNFATYYSPVFDRAFNGKFIEAETRIYNIVDFDCPDAFALVIQWIYTKSLGSVGWGNSEFSVEELCRGWVLGDRLLMPDMQDCAATELCHSPFGVDLDNNPLPLATWIYKETGPKSPLRRLFAYKCAYELTWEKDITSDAYEIPLELISEIASVYQHDALKCKKGHNCGSDANGWVKNNCCRCNNIINPDHYHINNIARRKALGDGNDSHWGDMY